MRSSSIGSIIFSLFFLLVIYTPLSLTMIGRERHQQFSASEKRALAAFPKLEWSVTGVYRYPKKFEAYFNDHFGLRGRIVQIHNYLLWKWFGTTSTKEALAGKDDWIFFSGDGGLDDYLGLTQFDSLALARMRQVITDRQYWLQSLGGHYLFLPIPNKESIYEEYLPPRIQANRGNTKYRQIVQDLTDHNLGNAFVDVQRLMLTHKKEHQLYHRTDSHWNGYGVQLVADALINILKPDLPLLATVPVTFSWQDKYSGDIAILLNLNGICTEKATVFETHPDCAPEPLHRMKELLTTKVFANADLLRLPVSSGCKDKTYKAILIHDSFGYSLRPYLNSNFKKIIYVNYFNNEDIREFIKEERPDLVIDERVSRNLEKALVYDPGLENEVLRTKFNDLKHTIFDFKAGDTATVTQFAKPESEGGSTNREGIAATENFPEVAIEKKDGNDSTGTFAIKAVIKSEQKTTVTLCYNAVDALRINDRHQCGDREVANGTQAIFFRVFNPALHGRLNIRFQTPGSHQILALTVKEEEE